MNRLVPIAAAVAVIASPVSAQSTRVRIQLDQVPVSELVTILWRDVLGTPYVVAPDVSTDRRTVSVKLDAMPSQARSQVLAYLRAMGLSVTTVAGVDQITTRSAAMPSGGFSATPSTLAGAGFASSSIPMGSPLSGGPAAAPEPPEVKEDVAVFRPSYRDPMYLADVLRTVFPKIRFGSRPVAQQEGATTAAPNAIDTLVFAGPEEDVSKARLLAAELDTRQAELSIKATVYEVQTGETNSSAIRVAFNLLGKLAGGYLTGGGVGDTFLRLQTRNVDAAVSALSSDSRFKVVTSPSVRTRSGEEAILTAGQQVPTLGSVSYQGDNSTPVQSVEYRDSGTILKVRPVVHADIIDVDIAQELSNFVRTDTGVNSSPTLIRRALTNRLSLRSGDVVLLGGLTEDRNEKSRSGLFKGFLGSRSRATSRTEIVVVLQVNDLGAGERAPAAKRGRTIPAAPIGSTL